MVEANDCATVGLATDGIGSEEDIGQLVLARGMALDAELGQVEVRGPPGEVGQADGRHGCAVVGRR